MPPTQALGSAFMLLATIIGVLVQIFFIHRCWRIFNKRVWSLVPLVLLVLTTLISGILAESFGNQGRRVGPGPMTNTRIACMQEPTFMSSSAEPCLVVVICLSCAFVVYVFVTTSTTVFICRTRTGLREHDGIFRMIWRVIWVSAAPPLITLTISIVNGYIVKSGSQNLTVVAGGLTAKFCNLSLMINLIGQVWIRRKFEVSRAPELPTISTSQTPGVISDPVFAISMTSLGAEGGQVTVPVETPITNPSDTFVSGHGDNGLDGSDTSSVKPAYDEARRSVHQVRFSMGP
ncbi:hypothetical protein OPQ81_007430 [Rhizoctonia solani]|nr:hypothetical protein OPQ81_007430 [Rhizoctonia solani]